MPQLSLNLLEEQEKTLSVHEDFWNELPAMMTDEEEKGGDRQEKSKICLSIGKTPTRIGERFTVIKDLQDDTENFKLVFLVYDNKNQEEIILKVFTLDEVHAGIMEKEKRNNQQLVNNQLIIKAKEVEDLVTN